MVGSPPGAQTTISLTPATWAATTPMTTVEGYGARPPPGARGGGAGPPPPRREAPPPPPGGLANPTPRPRGQRALGTPPPRVPRHGGHVGHRGVQTRPHVVGERLARRVELGRRHA